MATIKVSQVSPADGTGPDMVAADADASQSPDAKQLPHSAGSMLLNMVAPTVPTAVLLETVEARRGRLSAFMLVPYTVTILVVYIFVLMNHFDMFVINKVHRGVADNLMATTPLGCAEGTFNDIAEAEDIWTFTGEALMPLFWERPAKEAVKDNSGNPVMEVCCDKVGGKVVNQQCCDELGWQLLNTTKQQPIDVSKCHDHPDWDEHKLPIAVKGVKASFLTWQAKGGGGGSGGGAAKPGAAAPGAAAPGPTPAPGAAPGPTPAPGGKPGKGEKGRRLLDTLEEQVSSVLGQIKSATSYGYRSPLDVHRSRRLQPGLKKPEWDATLGDTKTGRHSSEKATVRYQLFNKAVGGMMIGQKIAPAVACDKYWGNDNLLAHSEYVYQADCHPVDPVDGADEPEVRTKCLTYMYNLNARAPHVWPTCFYNLLCFRSIVGTKAHRPAMTTSRRPRVSGMMRFGNRNHLVPRLCTFSIYRVPYREVPHSHPSFFGPSRISFLVRMSPCHHWISD